MVICIVTDELGSVRGWTLPTSRAQGHYWLCEGFESKPAGTQYTLTQMYHQRRPFKHPRASQTYQLLQRTTQARLPSENMSTVMEIRD